MSFYKTETCFRRYETVIAQALSQWPKPVRFKTSRAVTTDAARCRDAIAAFRENNWQTIECPDLFQKLKEGTFVPKIWVADDYVYIGPKGADKKEAAVIDNDQAVYEELADSFGAINFSPSDPSHVVAILMLVEHEVVNFPIAVDLQWQDTVEKHINDLLNVAIRPDEATQKLYIF